jgi:hypothetical protein
LFLKTVTEHLSSADHAATRSFAKRNIESLPALNRIEPWTHK